MLIQSLEFTDEDMEIHTHYINQKPKDRILMNNNYFPLPYVLNRCEYVANQFEITQVN